ncbi:MAG TPA: MFS transporter [Terriglobales bacterium]|nr:MFS transporter [Terriglobales bacterium]
MELNFQERYFKRNFASGVINGIFFNLALAFISGSTILPLFVSQLTNSDVLIGLSSTLETIGWLSPQLFVAGLTLYQKKQLPLYIRTGYVRVISFLCLVLSVFLFGAKHSSLLLPLFFLFFAVYALGGGFSGVAFMDIVGKTIPLNKRGSFFGMRMFFGGALAALAGILVKQILEHYQFPNNYGIIFCLAFFSILLGILSLLAVKEPPLIESKPRKSLKENLSQGIEIFKQHRQFRLLYFVQIIIGAYVLGLPFYVIYAERFLKIQPDLVGIFLTAQMIGFVLSNLFWGYLSNRGKNREVLLITAIISSFPPLTLFAFRFFSLPIFFYSLIFFFLGAINTGLNIGYMNYLLEISPEPERPIYVGLLHTLTAPTVFLSAVGGIIIQVSSFTFLYVLVLLISFAAIYISTKLKDKTLSS